MEVVSDNNLNMVWKNFGCVLKNSMTIRGNSTTHIKGVNSTAWILKSGQHLPVQKKRGNLGVTMDFLYHHMPPFIFWVNYPMNDRLQQER